MNTKHQDRNSLVAALKEAAEKSGFIRAAWLGGSDANGRTDAFSDIDFCSMCEDDAVERSLQTIKQTLAGLSPIEIEWRLPNPTWHGHDQAFYTLRDAGPHLMIDAVVIKKSAKPETRFLEVERHGTPKVLFDLDGWVKPVPLDRAAHTTKMKARQEQLRVRFPLLQTLVIRAIARDQPCDAAYFYMQCTLLPTVEALRMVHCPDRFDYGMRYLRDDLPRELYLKLCRLSLPGSLQALRGAQEECGRLFEEAVGGWG